MKSISTILLLLLSNTFMTIAWYGHLKFQDWKPIAKWGWIGLVLISWGLALFEYFFQVPANRIGYKGNGGPFTLIQLKVIQEVVALLVFVVMATVLFKNESFQWNHLLAFFFLIAAVYLVFK